MIEIPTKASAASPNGAPFYIDQCPFKYGEQIDLAVMDLESEKLLNWPMVYILANSDSAYVGQTTSVATRMSQHGASEEKKDFNTANIIFNEEFNSSVVTDYEHRLIGLMHADGKYRLTNKNDGMTNTNYYSKSQYSVMFESLWEDLRRLELADQTIAEIEESEVFKYSPYKGLTADQRVALDKILEAIETGLENASPIVVEGMPGTGKTILAIFLLKTLRDNPKYKDLNIKIIEPVTSLRNTLRKSLAGVNGISKDDIIGPADLAKEKQGFQLDRKGFDIVLVDESHKLKQRVNLGTQYGNYDKATVKFGLKKEATQLDWILSQTKLPIFFYDRLQSVGPSCVPREVFKSTLGAAIENPIRLDSQMRVRGGKDYLRYVSSILDGDSPNPTKFENYEFVLHDSPSEFVQSFEEHYRKYSLSRMIAGYAWEWKTKNNPDEFDIKLDNTNLKWNCTYDNWVGLGVDDSAIAHEVGCIHSIQGYDLSYAYVLIGDDLCLDENKKLVSNKASYYDRNGFATATKDELDQYIKNIYYVLLTRGIMGTHVYISNPDLRDYFKKYFLG